MPWPKPADFNFDTRLSSFSLAIEGKKKKERKEERQILLEKVISLFQCFGENSREEFSSGNFVFTF